MSVEHLAVVLHHSRATGTRKVVLIGIANHQGDGGSWPTIRTLARYANVQPRNVQKALAWLVTNGEVSVEHQAGGTRDMDDADRPNRYEVLVSCPSWCDRSTHHRDTRGRQHHLGLTPLSQTTPPRVSQTTPPRVSLASPEPSLEPTPPTPPPLNPAPCQECGQGQARCQAQQTHWPPADRHGYRPMHVLHATAGVPATTRRRRTSG